MKFFKIQEKRWTQDDLEFNYDGPSAAPVFLSRRVSAQRAGQGNFQLAPGDLETNRIDSPHVWGNTSQPELNSLVRVPQSSYKDPNMYLLEWAKETSKTRWLLNIHSNSIFYGSVNKHALNTTNVPHTYTHIEYYVTQSTHACARTHTRTHDIIRGGRRKTKKSYRRSSLKEIPEGTGLPQPIKITTATTMATRAFTGVNPDLKQESTRLGRVKEKIMGKWLHKFSSGGWVLKYRV